ncbi:MAG TPA: C13 family peptidase [Hyphomonadaceae bacterium]|jgi:hypothetical protein|nr:C13 family peptidase [Hyphomonadaceae bacterium]
MLKRPNLVRLALFALALAAAPAYAQRGQPQQQWPVDPQSFSVIESAMTPPEAAAQAELLSTALHALPPQRPGVVDTYILAASFWDDPVFEKEVTEAATILGRRYDASDRTIVLSAGRGGGARTLPNSAPNNVQAAIGKIAATIDPREDLVVIFVTSHGAPDGTVAIQERGRLSGGLRPLNLRDALQQAGIQNKLVIVSACFSGNFIAPFVSDANAAVLTAAAADRTSFGCEPQRDWTYFGDAFFNHALRGGAGITDSFNEALKLISKWEDDVHAKWAALPSSERQRQQEPLASNPQDNVGDGIDPLIAKAEAYGLAINCAGNISFAMDRVKTSRPLKGLADLTVLQTAKAKYDAAAAAEGAPRKRTAQETARSIGAVAAATLQIFTAQPLDVTARVARCVAPPVG